MIDSDRSIKTRCTQPDLYFGLINVTVINGLWIDLHHNTPNGLWVMWQ